MALHSKSIDWFLHEATLVFNRLIKLQLAEISYKKTEQSEYDSLRVTTRELEVIWEYELT